MNWLRGINFSDALLVALAMAFWLSALALTVGVIIAAAWWVVAGLA